MPEEKQTKLCPVYLCRFCNESLRRGHYIVRTVNPGAKPTIRLCDFCNKIIYCRKYIVVGHKSQDSAESEETK